jgi:hypothetical protein
MTVPERGFAMASRHLGGILQACYRHAMANLQVKGVPEGLHKRLRAYAKRRGRTLRDVVLEAVVRDLERDEFLVRLAKRRPVELGRAASETLEEAREERRQSLER